MASEVEVVEEVGDVIDHMVYHGLRAEKVCNCGAILEYETHTVVEEL